MTDKAFENKSIVLFDGYCHFCNSSVQFIIRHEKKQDLFFASLQSPTGKLLLKKYHINPQTTDSLVLIKNEEAFLKSSAALNITKYLKGLYPLLYAFIIVPPFIRNAVYDFIARNRYKWFGKIEYCEIPDEKIKHRFL